GKIEFRYGASGSTAGVGSSSVGLTGFLSDNFKSVNISAITASNSVAKDDNLGVPLPGTMYSFTPVNFPMTYVWSPAASLNSSTLENPTLSNYSTPSTVFTVTATNSLGCT